MNVSMESTTSMLDMTTAPGVWLSESEGVIGREGSSELLKEVVSGRF